MHRMIQLVTLFFIGLYAFLSQPLYSDNYIWVLIAILLFIIGTFRKPYETLAISGIAVIGYGGFQLYLYYGTVTLNRMGWNELIWLILFPFAAMVGSIGKSGPARRAPASLSLYRQLDVSEGLVLKEMSSVDEHLEFIGGSAFIYKLEEEVLRALRERRIVALVIVEIDHFWEYKDKYGYDQSQWLLNQVAELIAQVPAPARPEIKAHLGEGFFAVVLSKGNPEDNAPDAVSEFRRRINESFAELLMLRPRQESSVKIRLKTGIAECPSDGIEARSLMDSAQSDLEGNELQG